MLPRKRLILTLTATVVLAAAWIRSYYHADTLLYSSTSRQLAVGLTPGRLVFLYVNRNPRPPWLQAKTTPGLTFHSPPWNARNRPLSLPAGYGSRHAPTSSSSLGDMINISDTPLVAPTYNPASARAPSPNEPIGFFADITSLAIPLPAPLALLLLTLLLQLLRRRRTPPNTCPRCHYDLRATPTQCPECGHTPLHPNGMKTSPR